MSPGKTARSALAAVAVVAAATVLNRLTHANTITAGFVYLLAVLGLAIWQGFLAGSIGSLLAAGAFNFFFFTPIGTLRIADPQNWVSLACFLIATTVASRLVVRERERAAEAESGQREIAALYALCVDLFIASGKPGGLDVATSRALRTIGVQGGGLVVLPERGERPELGSWIGDPKDFEAHRLLGRSSVDELGAVQQAPGVESGGRTDPPSSSASGWRNVHIPSLWETGPRESSSRTERAPSARRSSRSRGSSLWPSNASGFSPSRRASRRSRPATPSSPRCFEPYPTT